VPDAETDNSSRGTSSRSTSFRGLLTDRAFGPFFFANSLSNIGNWFQNVAAGIVVYDLTGSSIAVGAVSIVQFVATMLLTPWMGGLTDRVDRKRMLLTGQTIALVGATTLVIAMVTFGVEGLPGPWPIYAATGLIGLGAAVTLPSLQAIVPALVRRSDLDRAISLNSMTFNIARSIGPIAAGAVIAAFGAQWAFGINALSFLPLIVVLLVITPRNSTSPDADTDGAISDGLHWIRTRPQVVAVLAATLVVGWTSDPFSTLMPALAEEFGGGDVTVGLLVGSFGFGAAMTAPLSDRVRTAVGRHRVIGLGLMMVAIGLAGSALSPVTALSLVAAATTGSGFLLGVTGTNAELQRAVPEALRGRVMAWWSVAFLGCRPIAAVVDGLIADLAGVRPALVVAATIAGAAGLHGWREGLVLESTPASGHTEQADQTERVKRPVVGSSANPTRAR
jgi:MFS family permease